MTASRSQSARDPRATGWRGRLVRDGLSMVGLIVVLWFFAFLGPSGQGYDAFAYWDVRLDDLYGRSIGQLTAFGAFRYSPPIAFLMAPLHTLSFEVFYWLWVVVQVAVLVWMARRWSLAACAFVAIPMSLYQGNIDLLIAASVILGMRHPAAWSAAILLKATPVIGLLWFAVRREWRALAVAGIVTVLVALPTVILRPDLWADYARVLMDNAGADPHGFPIPLWVRLVAAAGLAVWAARTDRAWLIAIAVAVAQPSLSIRSASVAVAAIPLWRAGRTQATQRESGPSGDRASASRR